VNFSYNWLRELVEGVEASPAELGRLITMKTAECEGVHQVGEHLSRVVAARVVSVEPIGGGHNVKAVVDAGPLGTKTVVCGASNCRAGITSAYVPAGTKLGGREIGHATIDGVESDGMLASGAELGVNRDAAGILEFEAAPGAPIPGCAPDSIIEIDNKSLTHRPDVWAHYGLAREVGAILRRPLLDPVKPGLVPDGPAPIKVAIEDFNLCPRYSALVFENVVVRPSPLWLQWRLEAIGLNPINNIVDVTNYILAELAQPMHAFDADLLHGDTIYVRPAPAGAVYVALNEQSYTLDPTNLVIADARGPVALGGVIGGLDSAINERTRRIVLESACFSASSIRKTSAKLKLRTDASIRFEKAQDPENTVRGLARAVELFAAVAPGIRLVGGLADQRKQAPAPPPITLPLNWLDKKLGRKVPAKEVRDILERLAFGVTEPARRVFSVTVPSWRATKDISIKDDLVEEVGRMVGYGSITPVSPLMPVAPPPDDPERLFHRQVRSVMTQQGFTEVSNYSFLSEEQASALGFDPAEHVRVANPIAADQSLMRLSLLPGIYRNILDNARHFETFRLFEIGREIHKRAEGLPDEVPHLVVALYGPGDGTSGLLEVKRAAECLMPGVEPRPAPPRPFEHPARVAELAWQNETVGRLFEFHPSMVDGRAAVLDVDLRLVERLRPRERRFRPIRRFPASAFDLSVVAGVREPVGSLRKRIVEFAGEQLDSIEFLRQYSGPPIPEGMKSVSFRLTVAAADRTLSLEEVGLIRARIIDRMQELGYELRV
jgi:phenylalanyl-tRNA synthetase beta chain